MKFYILFVLIVVGLSASSNAQEIEEIQENNKEEKIKSKITGNKNRKVDSTKTNTYMVEYNFASGLYDRNNLKPKVGTPITYKIKNINRLAYEVIVKTRDSILSQSYIDEDIIKFIQTFKKEDESKKEEPVSINNKSNNDIGEDITLKEDVPEDGKETINIIQESAKLSSEIGELNAKIKFSEEYVIDSEESKTKTDLLKKELSEKNEKLKIEIDRLNEIIEENSEYEDIIQDYFRENNLLHQTFAELRANYEKILISKQIAGEVATIANNPKLNYSQYQENYSERFKNISLNLPVLIDYNNNFNHKYSEFLLHYKNLKSYLSKLDNILTPQGKYKVLVKLENIKDLAEKMDSQTQNLDIEDLVKRTLRIQELLENEKNYEFISIPVQPLFDVVIFDVDIKKRNENAYPVTDQRKFNHKEFTRYGLRFDISVGVGGSLHSSKYSLSTEVDKEGNNIITENENDLFTPSFIGFFTTSYRSATHFTYGLSAGIGISAEDGSFTFDNFFVGPSFIVGRYERVMLTGGVSFRHLPSLNNSYELNDEIPNGFTIENVANFSYRPGIFIALSYNLTKGVKENIKRFNDSF